LKRFVIAVLVVGVVNVPLPAAEAMVPSSSYSFWNFPSPVSRLREQVVPRAPVGSRWFFATQFGTHDNGGGNGGGYIGLLENGSGRQILFSWWGALNATAPQGCTAKPFDEGSAGYHASCPYNWVNGRTYEYIVTRGGLPAWWDGWVCDVSSGWVCSKVGSIRVPSSWGNTLDMFNNGSVPNFVEWHGPDLGSCRNYPQADVYFGRPYGDLEGTPVSASWSGFGGGTACSPQLWFDGASAEHTVPGNVVYR
jgi:hypothetical protein